VICIAEVSTSRADEAAGSGIVRDDAVMGIRAAKAASIDIETGVLIS
jgi:hypothetical protein